MRTPLNRFTFIIFCFFVPLFFSAQPCSAGVVEHEVKAKWIDAISGYVKWKNKKDKKINICTKGLDGIYASLLDLQRKKSSQINIVNVKDGNFSECNILYIGASEQENFIDILDTLNGDEVLTVSSVKNFARRGGMIEFVIGNKRMHLLINTKSSEEKNIIIDNDLLGISETIYE